MAEKRILILEDEADIGNLFDLGLRAAGYTVDIATTIAEAHRRLDRLRYALVIADIRLPDGNGVNLADRAAGLGAKTYILSGYLFQMPAGSADRHELLMKPIRPRELLDAVQRAIGTAVAS